MSAWGPESRNGAREKHELEDEAACLAPCTPRVIEHRDRGARGLSALWLSRGLSALWLCELKLCWVRLVKDPKRSAMWLSFLTPVHIPYPITPVANRRRGPRQAVIMQHSPTNQPASTRCGHASCGSPSHSRVTYTCHMSSHAL